MNAFHGEGEEERTPRRARPRGRFQLTARGAAALESYRQGVLIAQSGPGGRLALEEFQTTWAQVCGIASRDALLLDEMATQPKNVTELSRGLDNCGMPKAAIESGIDRLAAVGLIDLAPSPAP